MIKIIENSRHKSHLVHETIDGDRENFRNMRIGDKVSISKDNIDKEYEIGDSIRLGPVVGKVVDINNKKVIMKVDYNPYEVRRLNEALEDDPEEADQEYSSANTSINSSKLPLLFKLVKFKNGSLNLDYGGGKFDNVAEYLKKEYNVTNLVYDPYNRTQEHNKNVLNKVRKNGGADTVTCSNVLNVIKEENARLAVIKNCKNYLKAGGTVYFTVYEGTGNNDSKPTKAGYQLNRKTEDYVDEIKKVFSNVIRKGKLIIAK